MTSANTRSAQDEPGREPLAVRTALLSPLSTKKLSSWSLLVRASSQVEAPEVLMAVGSSKCLPRAAASSADNFRPEVARAIVSEEGRFSAASGNHLLDHGIEGRCNVSEKREVGAARRSCNTGCTSDEVTAKHNTDTSFPSKLEGR